MKSVFTDQINSLLVKLRDQPRIGYIEKIAPPSPGVFFSKIAKAGYPIIIRDLLTNVLSEEQITSILVNKYGEFPLQVRTGNYKDPDAYSKAREYQNLTLRDYMARLRNPGTLEPPYAGNHPIPIEICSDIGVSSPPYYAADEYEKPAFWLGPKGSITPLHKDSTDNFSCQIWGEKKWILFPVRDLPHLYMSVPRPDDFPDFATSAIDLRNPDLDKFPKLTLARPITVTVRAGETLYLPTGWSHYVENLSESFMVNFWVSKTLRKPAILES